MDLCRDLAILVEVGGYNHQFRAESQSLGRGHGRMHPEMAGRVIAGGDNTAPVRVAPYGHGPMTQGRVITHFHGGIEAVAVHVDNLA